MTDTAAVSVGAVVVDRDADPGEQNEAVVVNTPPVPADEWDVGARTVAEYPGNEPYDHRAPVVLVVFRDDLDEWRPDYEGDEAIRAQTLAHGPAPFYSFPAPRLKQVGRLGEDAGGAEDRSRLERIADALRERRVDDVRVSGGRGVVEIDKLGVTYHVDPDGRVREQQGLAEQIERVARDAVDAEVPEA